MLEAIQVFTDFKFAEEKISSSNQGIVQINIYVNWKGPHENLYKANWEETLDKKNNVIGASIIVINVKGEVIAALCNT